MNLKPYWNSRSLLATIPVACKFEPACCAVTRLLVALHGAYLPVPSAGPQFPEPSGLPFEVGAKFGWLSKLDASMWNCRLTRPATFQVLRREKSSLTNRGPSQKPGGSLPKVPILWPTAVNAAGLYIFGPLRPAVQLVPVMNGRRLDPGAHGGPAFPVP